MDYECFLEGVGFRRVWRMFYLGGLKFYIDFRWSLLYRERGTRRRRGVELCFFLKALLPLLLLIRNIETKRTIEMIDLHYK